MRILFFLFFCSQAFGVSYHEVFCNRLEKENMKRKETIKQTEANLKKIIEILNHPLAEKHINRAKFLRDYKNWDYKNQRLKRKTENYIETAVTKGCPLI